MTRRAMAKRSAKTRKKSGKATTRRTRKTTARSTRKASTRGTRKATARGTRKASNRTGANVFADLGAADAEGRQTKLRLAHALNLVIARKRRVQAMAVETPGVKQPQVSPATDDELDEFTAERLLSFLAQLGLDV